MSSLPTSAALAPAYSASPARLAILRRRRNHRRIVWSLFRGEWREALIEGGVTQHRWRKLMRTDASGLDQLNTLVVNVNVIETAMAMHADILAGRPVLLSVPEGFEAQALALDQIRERVLWDALYHEAALRTNVAGEAALHVDQDADGAFVTLADNQVYFPVGAPGKDGQPSVWEGRWIIERRVADKVRRYLRIERHRVVGGRGVVEHEAYETGSTDALQDAGTLRRVRLAEALGPGAQIPPDIAETGLPYPALVQLANYRIEGEPFHRLSDGDLKLIDTLAAGMTRLARTMELHGDPRIRTGRHMLDQDGNFDARINVLVDPDKLFEYVTASFDFDALLRMFNTCLQWVIIRMEMASSLLGFKPDGGAAPDSYDKLRLEATNVLAAARRAARYHEAALGRAFTLASALEARLPLRGWPVGPVTARLRPQLPKDEIQVAREQSELLAAGLTSRQRAVAEVHGDADVDAVLAEIDADRQADTQRRQAELFSGFGGSSQTDQPAGGDQPEGAADGGEGVAA